MKVTEDALVFPCGRESLVGILARPTAGQSDTAVLVVVGGPQYRVGSHRQFVLLARHLAQSGIPCLRFDYRGMGDSTGDAREFIAVGDDIRAAVDALLKRAPGVKHVMLWGLCDGATAAADYAARDARVSGLVLVNPWVHTEQAEAQVYLRHYYLRRLTSTTFWRKLLSGEVRPGSAMAGAFGMIRRAWPRAQARADSRAGEDLPLPEQLYRSLTARPLDILVLLSGKDFVAREFEDLLGEERWAKLFESAQLHRLPRADHTLSDPAETAQVSRLTQEWIISRQPTP